VTRRRWATEAQGRTERRTVPEPSPARLRTAPGAPDWSGLTAIREYGLLAR
jgi:hypothetical protein